MTAEAISLPIPAPKRTGSKTIKFSALSEQELARDCRVQPVASPSQRRQKSAKVLPVDSVAEDHHDDHDGGTVNSGPAGYEIRSQSSAGRSSLSGSGLHRGIEAGLGKEDRVLVMLRRMLTALLALLIGFTIATTAISESVVFAGVSDATLTTLKGDRAVLQQVCPWCCLWSSADV